MHGEGGEARPAWQEADRLAALRRYAILDTPPEQAFDDVVHLLADLLDAPIAAVNLIDADRQWFKAEAGLGVREMALDHSICKHAILQAGGMVVPDTTQDPRFAGNPLVTGAPGLRFYAGELLETPEGLPLGTLCVLDVKPRPEGLTPRQRFALRTLARQVTNQLELRRLAGTLDRRAEEQGEALRRAEEQLRQSQKMEAVGQLTGGIAHDFNNLLQGIGGSLELLRRRVAQGRTEDLDRYAAAAQDAVGRAAALTHRLLAFSRRQALDPKPVDANRLVAGMEDLIRRTVGPAIQVETALQPDLWLTLCDPGQLENAVLNLCINARDAMAQPSPGGLPASPDRAREAGARPGGERLLVSTANAALDAATAAERDLPPGEYVDLRVTDSGAGMTPEVAARAFDPFFTTKPLGAGTGLGLSMVHGFLRQSGGQVRIRSAPGEGTTMRLLLPRHVSAAREGVAGPADAAGPSSPAASAGSAAQAGTVLVVDDEAGVRLLAVETLEDEGYRVMSAEDGADALRTLRSGVPVDLLLTDVGLPGGLNGRQLADAAREQRPGLPVLFITGYAEEAVLGRDALPPGMQVLAKPFGMDTLAAKVRTALGGHPAQ